MIIRHDKTSGNILIFGVQNLKKFKDICRIFAMENKINNVGFQH